MHQYLRAIGFRDALSSEQEVELLLDNLYNTHEKRDIVGIEDTGRAFWEIRKSFGPSMGICISGRWTAMVFTGRPTFRT